MQLLQARPPFQCSSALRELLQALPQPQACTRRLPPQRLAGRLGGVAQRRLPVADRCRSQWSGRVASASSVSPHGLASMRSASLQIGRWGPLKSMLCCPAPERSSGKCGLPYARVRRQSRMSKAPCRLGPPRCSPDSALDGRTAAAILLRERPAFSQGWLTSQLASSLNLMVMCPASPLALRHTARPRRSQLPHPRPTPAHQRIPALTAATFLSLLD